MDVKQKLIWRLVKKNCRKYARDVKVIQWQLQHRLVVVDLDKKILKKIVRKERIVRRVRKSNEIRTRVRLGKYVEQLAGTGVSDLWKTFKAFKDAEGMR